jgi:hypothetical protein
MKIRHVYLGLCLLGIILPYAVFIPWLTQNRLNIPLLVDQITSSPVAAFAWLDVVVAIIALFVFIYADNRERQVRYWWLAVIGTLLVGLSLGLPLYLYLRDIARNE